MSARSAQLRQVADQAVRDIVELDGQVTDGEIPAQAARELRLRYEVLAAQALAALDAAPAPDAQTSPAQTSPAQTAAALTSAAQDPDAQAAPERPDRPRGWPLPYTLAGVTALVAALVLLPASVLDRPAGGFVTGNEVVQGSGGAPPLDPSVAVSDEQLEQVVAANPGVVGMRLALADRYVAQGEYASAMRHYLDALRREPGNAEALAHLGWLLLQIDQPQDAFDSVQQALAIDPTLDDALWFRAHIQLALDDPAGAVLTLQELGGRDLSAEVRAQIDALAATAEQRRVGGTG